jgi:hypothetical protein
MCKLKKNFEVLTQVKFIVRYMVSDKKNCNEIMSFCQLTAIIARIAYIIAIVDFLWIFSLKVVAVQNFLSKVIFIQIYCTISVFDVKATHISNINP